MSLRDLWRHRYTGYFLEFLKFAVLLAAVLHVGDRVITAQTGGCMVYYADFNGVDSFKDVEFMSKSEYKEFKSMDQVYRQDVENLSLNYSYTRDLNSNKTKK